jgi:hypothetical protein
MHIEIWWNPGRWWIVGLDVGGVILDTSSGLRFGKELSVARYGARGTFVSTVINLVLYDLGVSYRDKEFWSFNKVNLKRVTTLCDTAQILNLPLGQWRSTQQIIVTWIKAAANSAATVDSFILRDRSVDGVSKSVVAVVPSRRYKYLLRHDDLTGYVTL